jgi:lipopolysaccharide/colanic/teichoic acid biosynthesis glycosyltransferase
VFLKIRAWEAAVLTTHAFKRATDVLLSAALLAALSPILLTLGLLIYLEDRGPVFFLQQRVGKDGRVFKMYKFRSMRVNAEALKALYLAQNESTDGVLFKMKRDPRVTRVGRWMRRLSLDETPQFLNVLKGDMSLVGPRPLPVAEVMQFTLHERKRLHVKPGITGIWQVSGRSDIPFKQQVELDLKYIRSHGTALDLWLLLRTVTAVLSGRGAY